MALKFCWNHTMSVESSGNCTRYYTLVNETKAYDIASDLTIEDVKSLQKMLTSIISFDAMSRSLVAENAAKYNVEEEG